MTKQKVIELIKAANQFFNEGAEESAENLLGAALLIPAVAVGLGPILALCGAFSPIIILFLLI